MELWKLILFNTLAQLLGFIAVILLIKPILKEKKPVIKELNEQDEKIKQELKRRTEGLKNIMNYTVEQAMGVKHE